MSLFRYTAISQEGKKYHGVIDAVDNAHAQQKLIQQKILMLSIKQISKKEHLNENDVYLFTDSLLRLLKAGLPLYEALSVLEEKYRRHKIAPVILDIKDQVKEGKSLSEALQNHEKSFGILYSSMIKNAENTASLDKSLEEISIMIQKRQKMKKKIISSSLYPAILLLFSIVVVFFIIFFVMPSLFEIFEGRSLSPFTSAVLSISKYLNNKKEWVFLFIALLAGGGASVFLCSSIRLWILPHIFRLPVIGPLQKKMALIRFSRTLSTLLQGGVAYEKALELSSKVMNHPELEKTVIAGRKQVLEGKKLSDFFKKDKNIPHFLVRMIAIGEEGGNFAQMLKHVAHVYEDDVEKMLERIPTILQPLLLIILGIIVGVVVLSILLPLTDVESFLKVG